MPTQAVTLHPVLTTTYTHLYPNSIVYIHNYTHIPQKAGLTADQVADDRDLGVLGDLLRVPAEVVAQEDMQRAHQDDQHRDRDDLGDALEEEALHEEVLETLGEAGVEVEVLPHVALEEVW